MTTLQDFLKDVSEHEIHILCDNGVYRHIRFKKPHTNCMHFDLVTWPGYLAYSGDMGCYMFSRLEDMFVFFRADFDKIDIHYWAEKLEAIDGTERHSAAKEYSPEKFKETVQRYLDEIDDLNDGELTELRAAIEDEVLSHADDGIEAAHKAADDFEHNGFQFRDFWECDLTVYTHRFLWCCFALAWGIKKYDEYVDHKKQRLAYWNEERLKEKYNAMPLRPWNGEALLYSEQADYYFYSLDGLANYCGEHECSVESLRLVICEPVFASPIDPEEHYCDDLPTEEGAELPEDLQAAFDTLNTAINACTTPLSWQPGKYAPTPESVSIDFDSVQEGGTK